MKTSLFFTPKKNFASFFNEATSFFRYKKLAKEHNRLLKDANPEDREDLYVLKKEISAFFETEVSNRLRFQVVLTFEKKKK